LKIVLAAFALKVDDLRESEELDDVFIEKEVEE
jgi:hypothetical protein